jgi:hypothetical protein
MVFDWIGTVQKECHSTDCDQEQQEHEQRHPAPDLPFSSLAGALPAPAPSSFFVCHGIPLLFLAVQVLNN